VRSRRLRYGAALVVCAAAVVWLVAGPLTSNVTYFRTVSEAVALRDEGDDSRFRIMGAVVAGSIREVPEGVTFALTDGGAEARVLLRRTPPDLFGAGVPVVCEGRWKGRRFESDRIMIRHGNEYRPPDVTTTAPPRP